jgi:hypothetical protein
VIVFRQRQRENKKILRAWLGCIGLIICLSLFGRKVQLLLVEKLDMGWVAAAVFALMLGILAFFYRRQQQYGVPKVAIFATLLLLAGGGIALYFKLLVPVETVHFLLFFGFGWLSLQLFGWRYAIFVVLTAAVGDEILQHYLPDRVGDLHDVLVNSLSGLAGIAIGKK